MAFTGATTRADGDVIDGGIFNTDVVDNVNWVGRDKPACHIYNSSDFAVASGGSGSAVTFDSETSDNAGMHSGSSSQIVIGTAGWYHVTASLAWDASVGNRSSWIAHNGTNILAKNQDIQARDEDGTPTPYFADQNPTMTYLFGEGDTIELVAFQDSGAPVNILAIPNYSPALAVYLVQVAA